MIAPVVTPAIQPYHIDALGYTSTDALSFDDWLVSGVVIHDMKEGARWAVGDWLLDGEARWPDRYQQALDETKQSYGGLRNQTYIARRFPRPDRLYALSWSHYAVAAPLPDDFAHDALALAQAQAWGRDDLAAYKKSITRKCPECGRLMVRRDIGQPLWVCASCEHEEPWTGTAPQIVRVRAEAECISIKGGVVLFAVRTESAPGATVGMTAKVAYEYARETAHVG